MEIHVHLFVCGRRVRNLGLDRLPGKQDVTWSRTEAEHHTLITGWVGRAAPSGPHWEGVKDSGHWLHCHCRLPVLLSSGFCSWPIPLAQCISSCSSFFSPSFSSFPVNKSYVYLFIGYLKPFLWVGQKRTWSYWAPHHLTAFLVQITKALWRRKKEQIL